MKSFSPAYKKCHSTETALLKVFNDTFQALDKGDGIYLALLDLSAAFDTVNHRILIERLRRTMKISGQALKWFESYLSDRSAKVSVNGHYSEVDNLSCSVPQGSKLGPRLYSDYVKPLGVLMRLLLLLFHMYADDSQLMKRFQPNSTDSQEQGIEILQDGIDAIAKWMTSNKLKLNQDKTEFMVISSKNNAKKITRDTLHLSTEIVQPSSKVRNLGVIMDNHVQMEEHINQIRKSAFYYLNWIKKIRPYLTQESAKSVVHALVISKIDYCNSLFVNLPNKLLCRLQYILHCAARLITGTPKHEHITPSLGRIALVASSQTNRIQSVAANIQCPSVDRVLSIFRTCLFPMHLQEQ